MERPKYVGLAGWLAEAQIGPAQRGPVMRLAGGSPQANEAPHFYETLVILLHCMCSWSTVSGSGVQLRCSMILVLAELEWS